jgi:prepilin-type N-terminal cleavage/methylation domain-containing protein
MASLTNALLRRIRSRMRGEAGFTLIELMVAVGIMLVALLALAYTATIGFSDIALARQRQGASGLANQTIEQIRALPFDVLKKGLSNADLTGGGDPNITGGCGATYCYGGEQIPRGANPNVVPLVPHTQAIVVGPTTYTVRAYVTYYKNVTTNNTFRLTVVVTWPNPARRGVSASVMSQTIAYSGTGCLSTNTHPFAAPCQPFFYANGIADAGHVDITGTLAGVSLATASVVMPDWSSNMQIEQISAMQGVATASGAELTLTGNPATINGEQQAASAADNDPAQPGNDYQKTTVMGSSSTITAGGGPGSNSITLTPSSGDPGNTVSTTDASVTHTCPLIGIGEVDLQPCGSSTEQQVGTMSVTIGLRKKFDLGAATLASVAAMPSVASSFSNRDIQPNVDGLVHSESSRSIGTVLIGQLPSNYTGAVPLGWAGYLVQISNFTDKATAETGTNTVAPTVTASGTISYWNGAGYTSVTLAPGGPINLSVASAHFSDTVNGHAVQIDIYGSPSTLVDCVAWVLGCPKTGGTSTSETIGVCNPACPATRTAATAQSTTPFAGDVLYRVTIDGEVQANLFIHVDLGTIKAQNTYQVAPSGA